MNGSASLTLTALLVSALCLFTGCQPQQNDAATTTTTTTSSASGNAGLNLAFIRLDSLQTGYTALANELNRLEDNATKAQDNIQKQVASLESEVRSLQNKMQQGLLAPNKIQTEQQRIGRKEQEIMQQRDIALGSIQQDQMRLQEEFGIKVKDILKILQEEMGYDMIFNEGGGSGLIMGSDKHDITPLVLTRLNALPVEEEVGEETEE